MVLATGSAPANEDLMTVTYLCYTAQQAGIQTEQLFVRQLGWNANDNTFPRSFFLRGRNPRAPRHIGRPHDRAPARLTQ